MLNNLADYCTIIATVPRNDTHFKLCLQHEHFFEVHSVLHLHLRKFSSASGAIPQFVKTDSKFHETNSNHIPMDLRRCQGFPKS